MGVKSTSVRAVDATISMAMAMAMATRPTSLKTINSNPIGHQTSAFENGEYHRMQSFA
jgi:hypothetical protein